ncbi:MAG: hypothetical protein A2Z16_03650 [Chloroflexi bacterium RBG_16_54_18]|nr:MAG: hypothetical protein A2Z16_03650 [Chloroflexi bacterium RBG_16_54_18]
MAIQKRISLCAALLLLLTGWLQPLPTRTETVIYPAFNRAFTVASASLSEDFEDGILEARITVESTGINLSPPGIQDIPNFGSQKAFGFGRSTCDWGCWDNRVTRLKISYSEPVYVYSISYKEMELYGNWGNGGKIYIDGLPVSAAGVRELGREPYNDLHPDTAYRDRLIQVNKLASQIEFRVNDITKDSEIFLDDLYVSGECVSTPAGNISWWSGDGHPFDLLGENDGIILGRVGYTQGLSGKAFSLDGQDDTLLVSDSPDLQAMDGEFSIEAWIQPLNLPSGNPAFDAALLERSDLDKGFALATRGSSLGLWIGTGIEPGIFTGAAVSSGSWTHAVGTYDGVTARLYLNGRLQDSQPAELVEIDRPLYLGSWHGSERFFQGGLDEITLYGRDLNAEEVLSLYESGSAGKCRPCLPPLADLAAWWPLDDGSGTVARELVNASNGVVDGASWANGKAGTALNFDGLDDYVQLPDAVSWVLLDSRGTLTTWVNPTALGDGYIIAAFGSGQEGQGLGLGINGQVRIYHQGEDFDWQTAAELPAGSWSYLAYTWDQVSESLFINGDLSASRLRHFNYIPGKARLGGGWWGEPANAYHGLIDELEVYSRLLSAEEISALYAAGCAGKCWEYTTLYLPLLVRKD